MLAKCFTVFISAAKLSCVLCCCQLSCMHHAILVRALHL